MKFTSIPKKLVLTGMSAAMVVAFAPAVAQAAVQQDDPTTKAITTTNPEENLVATLTYKTKENGKDVQKTQKFYSDAATTNDDALQAALVAADQLKVANTVTLSKDVVLDGFDEDAQKAYSLPTTTGGSIVIGGKTTLDLAGKTISEAEDFASPAVTLASDDLGTSAAEKTGTGEATVYAVDQLSAKQGKGFTQDGKSFYFVDQKDWDKDTSTAKFSEQTTTTAYYKVTAGDKTAFVEASKATDAQKAKAETVTDAATGKTTIVDYYTFKATWNTKTSTTAKIAAADDVTIKDGTITANAGQNTIDAKQAAGALTLDKATVTANGASAISDENLDTDVVLENGTAVTATSDKGAVTAIYGGKVSFQQTKAQKEAKASKYDSVATVTATSKKGYAYGIQAKKVVAETTGTVTATSGMPKATENVDGNGNVNPNVVDQMTSTAVKADNVYLNYGNYSADRAVVADDGYIYYGTYDGYVGNGLEISGGKFKYDPRKDIKQRVGQSLQYVQSNKKIVNLGVAQNDADSYYYVYRVGTANVGAKDDAVKSKRFVGFEIPTGVKDKDGNEYVSIEDYVRSQFLNDYTKARVFAAGDQFGQKVNDWNTEKEGAINVDVTASYGIPSDTSAKAGEYTDAYNKLKAQADTDTMTPQGLYFLKASTNYGNEAKHVDVEKDVKSLGNAELEVTAKEVTGNSDAKAFSIADAVAPVTATASQNIGTDLGGKLTWKTAAMGTYGVNVTTISDAQKKAIAEAQAAADKAAKDAQAKADQAAKDAQAAIDKAKADYQAQLAEQKAISSAKAKKVSGLKVKVGKKKATVSWKKVSGAVKYQVKYRQKNSSKTADFKYKTVKSSKYTAKNLKKGKYYNFKVRVYTKAAGKTYAGKWTSIVTGKIK